MGAKGDDRWDGASVPRAGIAVRVGSGSDAPSAASLHARQIAEGFLSFLGVPFLTRLYRRIAISPGSFVLVATGPPMLEDLEPGARVARPGGDGAVVGFVAGATDVGRLYRSFLWHDGARAGLEAAGSLLRGWRRAVETLRHGTGAGQGRGVELLAIAVEPRGEGHGVGTALVGSFLDEVVRRGGRSAFVVVAADNIRAVALYGRAGFRTAETFELHAGSTSLLLQWDLDVAGAESGVPPGPPGLP